MLHLSGYLSLFLSSFFAATIFPLQSEAVLTGLLSLNTYAPWVLITIASIGNTLGAVVNWYIGLFFEYFKDHKWFPVTPATLEKSQKFYHRYGKWSLLLSWAPFIGDPITVVAGVMREKFLFFVTIVAIAKTTRYIIVFGLQDYFIGS